MISIYYQIWVDAIVNSKDYKQKKPSWKLTLFVIITTCNALNIFTLYLWLKFFGVVSYLINIDFLPGTVLNNVANHVVQFASPFILINYFLIFHKDRYIKLTEKFQHRKGKLAMTYTLITALAWLFSVIIYGVLS